MLYLTISFLSFIFTIFFTQYLIRFLNKRGIVDNPFGQSRKVHDVPVPRLGGLVIFSVVIIITFIFFQDIWSKKFFLSGALLVFGAGLWDDLKPMKWYYKMLFQIGAANLLILSLFMHNFKGITIAGLTLPFGINYIILLVLIVGILNAFNMLDGLDGLVAGMAMIISAMCFILAMETKLVFLPILSAALIGATLGFLKFNANPARIFLGDSGSLSLGYFMAGILMVSSNSRIYNPGAAGLGEYFSIDILFIIIVLAVPILDTLRVMIVRMKTRKSPFLPDSNHIHHILYSKRIRHKTVVLLINTLSASYALLGVYYLHYSKVTALVIFAFAILLMLFSNRLLDIVIKKDNLLAYGRLYKMIPNIIPALYRNGVIPVMILLTVLLLSILMIKEIGTEKEYYVYFLMFLLPAMVYTGMNIMKNNTYVDVMVFLNFIIFFVITGLNGFFYEMHIVPLIGKININQIFIILFFMVIIPFILFKERIANYRSQFLTGVDLSIALAISFIFVLVQFTEIPQAYKISDTLLRSFLLFLFYKIVIISYPKFHFSLHFTSYAVSLISVVRAVT